MRTLVNLPAKPGKRLIMALAALLLLSLPALALAAPADAAEDSTAAAGQTAEVTPDDGTAADETDTDETDADTADKTPADGHPSDPIRVDNSVKLTLNSKQATFLGSQMQIDVAPFATNNTTMLPLRFIAQDILKADVDWDNTTNIVKVTRHGAGITIVLDSGKVYSDGQLYSMSVAPMVKDNRTLVPLRLITELMYCTVDYNKADQSILITLPETLNVQPPVADIEYFPATAGQTIEYTDKSTDPGGYEITEREWEVIDPEGGVKTGPSLYWLFYQKQGGDYTINYRVKNAYGVWSEPVTAEYHLEVNEKPEVTRLEAGQTEVDIGETVYIEYELNNEDWEDITAVSFNYSWRDKDGKTVTKRGLPAAFFTSGTHTVTLTVQDAFGQWSDEAKLEFEVSDHVLATEAEYRFTNLNPGEIYLNIDKTNLNGLLAAEATRVATQPVTLLDSNSPEKVNTPGLLYKDTVTGRATLHYHHLNNSQDPLNIYLIAHNETDQPLILTLGKAGYAGPSLDPMQVGYIETQNYLKSDYNGAQITLKPGEMYLINLLQATAVNPNTLQSALVDIETTGQLTVAVAAMTPGSDYRTYTTLPALPAVEPQTRGTYANAVYDIYIDLDGSDAQKIMLGYPDSFSGKLSDYLISGIDAMTGTETYNKGNYGVIQQLHLTAAKRTGILVNPRGAIFRGAILWNDELCLLSASGQISTTQESVVAGVIEAGEEVTITYITPDGSDSPVLFVAIPEDQWDEY